MEKKISLSCIVNGEAVSLMVAASERLVDMLRRRLFLTGTKEGCGIGECGACTVLINGVPVSSCLVLAAQVEGKDILTIEGLSKESEPLHPIQQAFLDSGAVQCGFCTPAMILCSYALIKNNPNPTKDEIKKAISGNLCRCTGYKQIIDAVLLAAKRMREREDVNV